MDDLKWDLLTDIQGRVEAEILKTFLVANGIVDVELFQESLGQHIYPTALDILGNVQMFVPKEQREQAGQLLEEYQDLAQGDPEEDDTTAEDGQEYDADE